MCYYINLTRDEILVFEVLEEYPRVIKENFS